jgi:photosystem II stability/assembly factor-like uncharacterized protein
MQSSGKISPKPGDVLLMIGTMKGIFLLSSNSSRQRWKVSGPHFPGEIVYALAYDGRAGRHRIWSAPQSPFYGAVLCHTDDFGKIWSKPETANIKFPEDTGLSLNQVWQITPGRDTEPDVLYCGVEPASLFKSTDAGETWSLNRGLHDHPHRPRWEPGAGGLCLHTILLHPTNNNRIFIATSTGGVYRTDDGGLTWHAKNKGVSAEFLPDKYPEFGQCVHKVTMHPSRPDRLFLQNHGGLFRSFDGGETWESMANGVPSDFGFPIVSHPHDPDTFYIVPLDYEMRCVPEAKLRIYRTQNAGKTWKPLTRGLPQKGAYETILRDGMSADSLDPAGIYFGTRSGKVYGSANNGNSWKLILDDVPPVTCVKAAVIGENVQKMKKKPARKTRKGK